jgi:hypothetical protein
MSEWECGMRLRAGKGQAQGVLSGHGDREMTFLPVETVGHPARLGNPEQAIASTEPVAPGFPQAESLLAGTAFGSCRAARDSGRSLSAC